MNVRFATTAVVAAAGAALLAVAPAATAAAPTSTAPAEQAAPNFEAQFPVSVKGAQVTFRGKDLTLDLTGEASLTFEGPTPGDLEAKASGTLNVSAQHPDLGKITVESKATGTASFNSVLNPFPVELDLSTSGTVTIENPGNAAQRGMAQQPLVLTTKNPVPLAANLEQFPPKGDFTKLVKPAELVDGNGDTIATIDKFPVTVGS